MHFPLWALQLAATRTILWISASRSNLQRGRVLCDCALTTVHPLWRRCTCRSWMSSGLSSKELHLINSSYYVQQQRLWDISGNGLIMKVILEKVFSKKTNIHMHIWAEVLENTGIHTPIRSMPGLQLTHKKTAFCIRRNDETKWRNEMTKSLNDNTGFGVVGIVQIFIFHEVGSRMDTEWSQAIMYVRCCCFPDLSHVNIQGVKHIQFVIMQRDLSLKTSIGIIKWIWLSMISLHVCALL